MLVREVINKIVPQTLTWVLGQNSCWASCVYNPAYEIMPATGRMLRVVKEVDVGMRYTEPPKDPWQRLEWERALVGAINEGVYQAIEGVEDTISEKVGAPLEDVLKTGNFQLRGTFYVERLSSVHPTEWVKVTLLADIELVDGR